MEVQKWLPDMMDSSRGFIIYEGSTDEREEMDDVILKKVARGKTDFCILTNKEMINPNKNYALYRPEYAAVIIDEGHSMKNTKGMFASAMRDLIKVHRK